MAKEVLAFDIGGTSIRAAVVDAGSHKIKKLLRCPTPNRIGEFLKRIDEFCDCLLTKNIKGIGISCAGVISNGVVKISPNLPIRNFDMNGHFKKKFKGEIKVFNDAGCFSLAELRLGVKRKNFIILTLGTGIGGGIIINGKSYNGGGYGGELGHTRIRGKDWESMWQATRRKIKKTFKKDVLIKDLVKMNDKKAKDILGECGDYLGEGIASLISVFDPEVVVLAGGPKEAGSRFLNEIKKNVKKYSFLPKKTPVVWTKLKESGVLGASLLV